MNQNGNEYASKLSDALARITKTPALTSGILDDAASVIAREGCLALDTHRVGIWGVENGLDSRELKSISSYNSVTGEIVVQEDFPLGDRPQYVRLLGTERLIVINDAQNTTVLANLTDTYGPNICSLLDAPIRRGGKLVDVTRIKQILINLLTNAVKFANSGHIVFSVHAEPMADPSHYSLKVSVTDTGIGIRKEDLPLLFGNFAQLDTRKNRSVEGTGLGLAIARNLVELMGGEIKVESVHGEGSRFSFSVPQLVEHPQPALETMPDYANASSDVR